MPKEDDIFLLIKEMNRNEKRFFRLQATQQGNDKTYLKVFDLLDKQKEFDAEKLKTRFSNGKINLSHEKAYLENNILRSLRSFYSDNTELVRLKNLILNIDLLYQKRLHHHVQKLIDKGMQLAKKYEYYTQLLELIELQYRLYARTGKYNMLKDFENTGMKEKEKVFVFLNQQLQLENLVFKITALLQTKGNSPNEKEKDEMEIYYLKSAELLKTTKHSFFLTELCLTCLYMSAAYLNKQIESLSYNRQIVKLYNDNPHFISERLLRYHANVNGIANRFYNLKRYSDALKVLDKAESLFNQMNSLKQKEYYGEMFSFVSQMRLMVYIAQKEYDKAVEEAEKFESTWDYKSSKERNNLLWMIKIHIVRAHFFAGNYKISLEHVYALINNSDFTAMKREIIEHAYLLRLMIYYELQLFPLIENLCRTTLRFFEKQGEDEFARRFINGIRNTVNAHGDKIKVKKVFNEFAKSLEKIPSRLSEKQDFTEWVERKTK